MKRKIVLSESKFRGLVKNIITEILVKKAYNKFYSDVPEDEYTKIASVDKTRGDHLGAYAKWLLELYKENKFNLNNLDKAKKYISVFDRMAQAGQLKGVDINTFDSIDDMYEIVKDNLDSDVITKGDRIRKVKETGVERIYQDSDWLVISPKTHEASCHYGANTKWCTTEKDNDSQFKNYISEGPLYILINKKTNKKYQIHFETNSYMNEYNENINVRTLKLPKDLISILTKGDKIKSLKLEYDSVGEFENGFANIGLNGKSNFINQKGELLSPNQWFFEVGKFNYGFAEVRLNDGWNFITQNGKLLSSQWFDSVDNFENEFATVQLNDKWNFIGQNGELISPNQWFDNIYYFEGGVAKVELNKKQNLINKNGELLSEQWFDGISFFKNSIASIKLNNKYNFINQNGDLLSPKKWFKYVFAFKGEFAKVVGLNGKYSLIKQNGEMVFPEQWFDVVYDFKDDIANVGLDNKRYKVNINDKTITEIT